MSASSTILLAVVAGLSLFPLPPVVRSPASRAATIQLTSATPGHEVVVDCVVLAPNQPMQLVRKRTPFTLALEEGFVFAAFEPAVKGSLLNLEYTYGSGDTATVTAPRVMVGRSVGGVSTAFVQGY